MGIQQLPRISTKHSAARGACRGRLIGLSFDRLRYYRRRLAKGFECFFHLRVVNVGVDHHKLTCVALPLF